MPRDRRVFPIAARGDRLADMHTYRITVRYDGARYKGWQRLGKDAGGDTIQAKLEAVMATLCGQDVLVTGSGRTDAGVHALAQIAHFRCEAHLEPTDILNHAARYLPDDIAVTAAEAADERFHARYKVTEKRYLYRLDTGEWPDPFQRKYAWHVPESLDEAAMGRAARALLGEHDFSAFTSMKSKKKSAVRTLRDLEIFRPSPGNPDPLAGASPDAPLLLIRLTADGFLHNMARIIVGTLVEVGRGQRDDADIPGLLAAKLRAETGSRAPAKGLFLEKAVYA